MSEPKLSLHVQDLMSKVVDSFDCFEDRVLKMLNEMSLNLDHMSAVAADQEQQIKDLKGKIDSLSMTKKFLDAITPIPPTTVYTPAPVPPKLPAVACSSVRSMPIADPKCWILTNINVTPVEDVISRTGPDHRPTFTVKVTAGSYVAFASASTVKLANKAAYCIIARALGANCSVTECDQAYGVNRYSGATEDFCSVTK
jgi:hypothetical protein